MTDLVPVAWKVERKRLWHPSMVCVRGVFPTHGFTGKFSFSKYTIPAQIRGLHRAAQGFSQVRRDWMLVVQSVFRQNEFAVGVKNNKIRIVARGDASLVSVATGQASGALCHPVHEIKQRESSSTGLSPHQRQRDGETGNPAPGGSEITLVQPLHRWRAGRMVGDHHVDRSLPKALPQSLAILMAANGRCTFVQRRSIGNRFGGEMQVMRTGLHGHAKSFGASSAEFRERPAGGEMDDVQVKAVFAAQGQ